MKKTALFLIVGSMVLLLSCNTASEKKAETTSTENTTSTFDLSKARAAIDADNLKFSEHFKQGDSTALAAHYASDAWAMYSNYEPFKGKDIASAWGATIRSGIKEIKINTTDLVGNAEYLIETGTYEMLGDAGKSVDKGKYVVVWKQENGTWKIYRDIGNTNLPAK